MEDFNAVAATLGAGLSDIRACLILSRDGLILGGYPEGAEFDAKPAWLKLAAMGEPERGFLQFGTETWCFVRRGPYAAMAVTGTEIRPGLVIEQMDRVLFTAEETRARREGPPIAASGPAPTTKPRTQLHPDPIPEDERVVIHLEPSSLFDQDERSSERSEPAAAPQARESEQARPREAEPVRARAEAEPAQARSAERADEWLRPRSEPQAQPQGTTQSRPEGVPQSRPQGETQSRPQGETAIRPVATPTQAMPNAPQTAPPVVPRPPVEAAPAPRPVEQRPAERQPAEARPAEPRRAEPVPAEPRPAEPRPAETAPATPFAEPVAPFASSSSDGDDVDRFSLAREFSRLLQDDQDPADG